MNYITFDRTIVEFIIETFDSLGSFSGRVISFVILVPAFLSFALGIASIIALIRFKRRK